ncbi:MAG: FAD-dependent oxidoreductase [Pirellulaceae bacterium]|nr:FAD-dependent oxidoreductase [Pirellulaceae bacterium]
MRTVFAIIVGQGLAGTALAWTLAKRSLDFAIIDSGSNSTSSRIAAGLVTPITGQRGVKTWRWEEAWRAAQRFYREIESRTNSKFWSERPSIRLYDSEKERSTIDARLSSEYREMATSLSPDFESDKTSIDKTFGGFMMKDAARLHTPCYLDAARKLFLEWNSFHQHNLDLQNEVEVASDAIRIPRLGLQSQKLIFCQGYIRQNNPWFTNLPLVPAQGDILLLDIPRLDEARTIHRGVWLTPSRFANNDQPSSRYLVGSTYRWQPLDGLPSEEAREEILSKLKRWLKIPFEVIDHYSAIRPTSFDQKPLVGPSSIEPRIWAFNGLGAKGALLAPWCADHLVSSMVDGTDVIVPWHRK